MEGGQGARSRPPRRGGSYSSPEDPMRPHEHHHNEQKKGQHIGELDRKVEPADRDDLAHDEGGDEPTDHIPEPAEHAYHESDRAKGIADQRVNIEWQCEW